MHINDQTVVEALEHYREKWQMWLELIHTTDHERELAHTKIRLIDNALNQIKENDNGPRRDSE